MSVKIGQEFRRLGRFNLVVCGILANNKIQVYQKIKIRGSNITRTLGREVRIEVGKIIKLSEKKHRLILSQDGLDWYARDVKEILEFTEEELINFDAEVAVEIDYKKISCISPNGTQTSRIQKKRFPIEQKTAED